MPSLPISSLKVIWCATKFYGNFGNTFTFKYQNSIFYQLLPCLRHYLNGIIIKRGLSVFYIKENEAFLDAIFSIKAMSFQFES